MVGDPGFFDSLFKVVGKGVGFLARRSPAGQVVSGISEIFRRPSRPPAFTQPGAGLLIPEIATGIAVGAAPIVGAALAQRAVGGANGCQSGFHLNRSSYFLMDGSFVPEGSRCVKNRRRNQYNRAAASKAAARLKSLGKGLQTIKKSVGIASRSLGNK